MSNLSPSDPGFLWRYFQETQIPVENPVIGKEYMMLRLAAEPQIVIFSHFYSQNMGDNKFYEITDSVRSQLDNFEKYQNDARRDPIDIIVDAIEKHLKFIEKHHDKENIKTNVGKIVRNEVMTKDPRNISASVIVEHNISLFGQLVRDVIQNRAKTLIINKRQYYTRKGALNLIPELYDDILDNIVLEDRKGGRKRKLRTKRNKRSKKRRRNTRKRSTRRR